MSTAERAIGILACLAPLTGSRATGTAIVKSTGATGSLPAGAFAFPVIGSQTDYSMPFRHASMEAPGHPRAAPIVQAGTVVPISSVLGGKGTNLPAGTPLVWFPSNAGVEAISAVGASPLMGGDSDPSPVSLASLVWAEEPINASSNSTLLKTALARTPAGILQWAGRSPTTRQHGPKTITRTDQWQLLVAVGVLDGHHPRGMQGMTIVDLVEAELADRASVDGQVISSPPIKMLGARPLSMASAVYLYGVRFETSITVESTDDTKRAAYADWERTRFDFPTMADEGSPTFDVLEGATYPQP